MDTTTKNISLTQLRELEKFGSKINKLGVNFAVCYAGGELVLLCNEGRFDSDREQLTELGRRVLNINGQGNGSGDANIPVWRFGDANLVLAVVLKSARLSNRRAETVGVVLIDLGDISLTTERNVPDLNADNNFVQNDSDYFAEMLVLLAEKFQAEVKAEEQIEMVGTELSRTYEELVLLHRISTNMKVTESDANFLQMACDSLTEIIFVEGIAVLLEKTVDDKQQLVIAAGSGLIDLDEQMAAVLYSRLEDEINDGKEALLDS